MTGADSKIKAPPGSIPAAEIMHRHVARVTQNFSAVLRVGIVCTPGLNDSLTIKKSYQPRKLVVCTGMSLPEVCMDCELRCLICKDGLLGRELSTKCHRLTWMGGPDEIIRSYGLCVRCHTPKICKIHTKYSYLTATANGLK